MRWRLAAAAGSPNCFPDMPQQVRHDLLPLLTGNLSPHIAEVRRMQRAVDIDIANG